MTALDCLVPKVADWFTTKYDSKYQGDAPSYHHDAGNDRDDCESSDREDAMVEEKKRQLCEGDCSGKGNLRRPIGLIWRLFVGPQSRTVLGIPLRS